MSNPDREPWPYGFTFSRGPHIGTGSYPGYSCMGSCTCICGCRKDVEGWKRACDACISGQHRENREDCNNSKSTSDDAESEPVIGMYDYMWRPSNKAVRW